MILSYDLMTSSIFRQLLVTRPIFSEPGVFESWTDTGQTDRRTD